MTEFKDTSIYKQFQELKTQFVITTSHTIERLVAVGTDDYDYYWITYDGRKLTWSSCVGKIIPLKGFLKDEHYRDFEISAVLNHQDYFVLKSDETDMTIENYKAYLISKFGSVDRLLTNLYLADENI